MLGLVVTALVLLFAGSTFGFCLSIYYGSRHVSGFLLLLACFSLCCLFFCALLA